MQQQIARNLVVETAYVGNRGAWWVAPYLSGFANDNQLTPQFLQSQWGTFKAINAFWQNGKKSSSAYRINDTVGVFMKYAGAPRGAAREYVFTFAKANLEELTRLREQCTPVFVAMVCIKTKEICVISYLPASEEST